MQDLPDITLRGWKRHEDELTPTWMLKAEVIKISHHFKSLRKQERVKD